MRRDGRARSRVAAAAAAVLMAGCGTADSPAPTTTVDTSFQWTESDSVMAAACVLEAPQDGRFDVRYVVVGACIGRVRPDVRSEDVERIAATAVDCGTWSEGEPASYRLANISGCLEDALPRVGP